MPFQIEQGNILDCRCGAVINPTDEVFSGSGGLDRQIHLAAGPGLREECDAIGALGIGQAVLTGACELPCRAIIHTVAPWWSGREEELALLRECYRSALRLALENGLTQLAFPLVGSGTRGFPKETVLEIAAQEIGRFLSEHDEFDIRLIIRDRGDFQPRRALLEGLESYRDSLRMDEFHASMACPVPSRPKHPGFAQREWDALPYRRERPQSAPQAKPSLFRRPRAKAPEPVSAPYGMPETLSLDARLVLDESFSEMVMRKIDERGFQKDSECYVRANLDRRLFSKIRSDAHYHPKKTTAVALAVALELPLNETKELLEKAGYSLSHSLLFDVIVEYCISQKNYDIFQINELLFQYDQPLLGG